MHKLKITVILFFVIISSGCSAIKVQTTRLKLLGIIKDVNERAKACTSPIEANPKYNRIYEKFGVAYGKYPTELQMQDQNTISDSDIKLGIEWYGEYQYCYAKHIQDASNVDPGFGTIYTHVSIKQIELVNEIVTTHPTYAYINNKIYKMGQDLNIEGKQWRDDLERRIEQNVANQSSETFLTGVGSVSKKVLQTFFETVGELVNTELEFAKSVAAYSASQPTYIVTNPIRTTNCSVLGNFVSCTTY